MQCEINKTVSVVQRWLGLSSIIFHPQWEGGLGVPNVEWIYRSTRFSHLVKMLNNDDQYVRNLVCSFLFLDMRSIASSASKETQWETGHQFYWFWSLVRLAVPERSLRPTRSVPGVGVV